MDKLSVVDEVIQKYGGVEAVKVRFGYKDPMGVYQWRQRGIPKNKIVEIHFDTGISLIRLNQAA